MGELPTYTHGLSIRRVKFASFIAERGMPPTKGVFAESPENPGRAAPSQKPNWGFFSIFHAHTFPSSSLHFPLLPESRQTADVPKLRKTFGFSSRSLFTLFLSLFSSSRRIPPKEARREIARDESGLDFSSKMAKFPISPPILYSLSSLLPKTLQPKHVAKSREDKSGLVLLLRHLRTKKTNFSNFSFFNFSCSLRNPPNEARLKITITEKERLRERKKRKEERKKAVSFW